MRKALLAIVLAVATLVPIGLTASPAAAATCGPITYKQASTAVGGALDGTYLLTIRANYRNCFEGGLPFKKVTSDEIIVDREGGSCGATDKFRANPDTLGDWNPGAKEVACSGYYHFAWDAPSNDTRRVYNSDSYDKRCLGGYVTFVDNVFSDITRDTPTICIA